MALEPVSYGRDLVTTTGSELATWIETIVPQLVRVLVFVVVAYLAIQLALRVLRRVLRRVYDERETLVSELIVTVAGSFLWFGVALAALSMLGLGASRRVSGRRPGSSRWASPTRSRT